MCNAIDMYEYDRFLQGLGRRLRLARESCGLNLEQAACEVSVGPGRLELFEDAKVEPQSTVLGELARVYGVSVDWLVGTSDSMFPDCG